MSKLSSLKSIKNQTLISYGANDWRNIVIKENGELLVRVPKEISHSFYHIEMNLTKSKTLYLRESVLRKVLLAKNFLNIKGYDLKVYDGWRSIGLQENLFWHYMKLFTAKKLGLEKDFENSGSIEEIKDIYNCFSLEQQKILFKTNVVYVSWPTRDFFAPSPHATGGAVDVWLYKDGKPEDLGVPFDWMEENASVFYHLNDKRQKFQRDDSIVCQNRELLILAMVRAGFSCYPPEIWHFNYGNQMDALVKNGCACYSYTEPQ